MVLFVLVTERLGNDDDDDDDGTMEFSVPSFTALLRMLLLLCHVLLRGNRRGSRCY